MAKVHIRMHTFHRAGLLFTVPKCWVGRSPRGDRHRGGSGGPLWDTVDGEAARWRVALQDGSARFGRACRSLGGAGLRGRSVARRDGLAARRPIPRQSWLTAPAAEEAASWFVLFRHEVGDPLVREISVDGDAVGLENLASCIDTGRTVGELDQRSLFPSMVP